MPYRNDECIWGSLLYNAMIQTDEVVVKDRVIPELGVAPVTLGPRSISVSSRLLLHSE